jgi:hypothetical protein
MTYLGIPSQVSGSQVWDGSKFIGALLGTGGGGQQRLSLATATTTVSTASVVVGQVYWSSFDWSTVPSSVQLRVIGNVTNPPHTASLRLFNLNNSEFVSLGDSNFLTITASNSTFATSSNILGNLTDGHLFELRISSSLSSSAVILGNAEFYIQF